MPCSFHPKGKHSTAQCFQLIKRGLATRSERAQEKQNENDKNNKDQNDQGGDSQF